MSDSDQFPKFHHTSFNNSLFTFVCAF